MKTYVFGAMIDSEVTYYLSGPMTGYPDLNYPAFEKAEEILTSAGVDVVSPHHVQHDEATAQFGDYLADDLAVALNSGCRGIILLPGWPQSKGARVELMVALHLDWSAYFLRTGPDGSWCELIDFNRQETE